MLSLNLKSAANNRLSLRLIGREEDCQKWIQPLIGFQKVPAISEKCRVMQDVNDESPQEPIKANRKGKVTLAETRRMTHGELNIGSEVQSLKQDVLQSNKHQVPIIESEDSTEAYPLNPMTVGRRVIAIEPSSSPVDEDSAKAMDLMMYPDEAEMLTTDGTFASLTFPDAPTVDSSIKYDHTQLSTDSSATPETKYFSSVSTSDDLSVSDTAPHTALSFYTEKDVISSTSPSYQTTTEESYKVNTEVKEGCPSKYGSEAEVVNPSRTRSERVNSSSVQARARPRPRSSQSVDSSYLAVITQTNDPFFCAPNASTDASNKDGVLETFSGESVATSCMSKELDTSYRLAVVASGDASHIDKEIDEQDRQQTEDNLVPVFEAEAEHPNPMMDELQAMDNPEKSFKVIWSHEDKGKEPKAWYNRYHLSGDNGDNDKQGNPEDQLRDPMMYEPLDDSPMFYCRGTSVPVSAVLHQSKLKLSDEELTNPQADWTNDP